MNRHKTSKSGTDSLAVYPGYLIRRLNQISTAHFVDVVSATGLDLTPAQFASLYMIAHTPGLDLKTLASRIGHDRVTTGGAVERLVRKGFILRRQSARDRRSRELFPKEAGLETLRAALPGIAQIQGRMLDRLSADEAGVFIELLRKVVDE